MRIKIIKATGKAKCRHEKCSENSEYIQNGRIKKDTICAIISTDGASGWHTSCYCRDCIDMIYEDMKKILNPKLWIFT